MNIELESMAIEMPVVEGHPNRVEFRGVLTRVDAMSDRAPSGAKGHRVILPRAVAEAGLGSLLGMGLDYATTWDRHDAQNKVGVITRAEIAGRNLEIGGYLFAKDFPEVVREVSGGSLPLSGAANSRSPALGMSYEVAEVQVADLRASVWTLTHVMFTGAAILRREKAAYRETWIELSGE